MKVCVLGAGLAGLACAYHLSQDDHEVVVVDREGGSGQGASRANGGQLSYSYVAPLAGPGVARKGVRWLLDGEAPLRLRPQVDPRLWRWLLGFVHASRRDVFEQGTRDMLALAFHSRTVLAGMMATEALSFSYRQNGKLVVFRDDAELAGAGDLVTFQKDYGARQQLLSRAECLSVEPALRDVADRLSGGVFTPDEAVGDAFEFCFSLQVILTERPNVTFMFNTNALSLEVGNGSLKQVVTDKGVIEADHFVLSSGIGALAMTEPLGIALPLYPLKGYSLTVPTRLADLPPRVSVTDAHHKVVYAPLDEARDDVEGRLRVAGMVDLIGFSTDLVERRLVTLTRQAREVFPTAGQWGRATQWAGLRPATPDWKPILGESGVKGLWFNVGHGGLGFTIASGTGQILADLVAGRPTRIPVEPYKLHRPKVDRSPQAS